MSNAGLYERLRDNLAQVRGTIADACRRAGRDPEDVRLVAVTKYVDLEVVRALLEIGVADFGENRVQQLADRAEALGASEQGFLTPPADKQASPCWHMIGHLQRNKVRVVLRHSRILHSLDSVRLLGDLEKEAAKLDVAIDAFFEINVAGEQSKSGAPISELRTLAEAANRCPHIRLRGLMTMAPFVPDPEIVRPHFARLREHLEELRRSGVVGPECKDLSMGMTNDYAVAVEEGATVVRVGSALFEGVGAG